MAQQYPVPSGVLQSCLINHQEPMVGEILLQAGVYLTVTLSQKVNNCVCCKQGSAPSPRRFNSLPDHRTGDNRDHSIRDIVEKSG